MLKFSLTNGTLCSHCRLTAMHGFFSVSFEEETRFLCSACAQREFPRDYLQHAIEAHRSLSEMREAAGAVTTPRPIKPSEEETIIRPIPSKLKQDETIIRKIPSNARTIRRIERTKNP